MLNQISMADCYREGINDQVYLLRVLLREYPNKPKNALDLPIEIRETHQHPIRLGQFLFFSNKIQIIS